MAIFITAYQRRTSIERITFRDANGAIPALGANDHVRVKIGRAIMPQQTPLLDITSAQPLAGGSFVTAVNPATLEVTGDDLVPNTIQPGTYDIEANVVDSADGGRIKMAEQGIFVLLATEGGGVT